MSDSVSAPTGAPITVSRINAKAVTAERALGNTVQAVERPQTDALETRRTTLADTAVVPRLSIDAPQASAKVRAVNAAAQCAKTLTVAPTSCMQFAIGDTKMSANIYEWKKAPLLFFNMHDNEKTSVESALPLVRQNGGRLVELQHGGERDISFTVNGRRYGVDPNRIFTPAGIKQTLVDHGATSPAAEAAVAAFSAQLVDKLGLDRPEMIVALHNNTDGAPLDMSSYLPGGMYAHETAAVFVSPNQDADDFFLVLDPKLFDSLRAADQNVTRQDTAKVTDDGRLAIYRGRKKLPYVNVEAQHGHLAQQKAMLEALDPLIRSSAPAP